MRALRKGKVIVAWRVPMQGFFVVPLCWAGVCVDFLLVFVFFRIFADMYAVVRFF